MPDRPGALVRLLESSTPAEQDEAWARLIQAHTDLLLRTAGRFGGGHDAVMDRYAFILDELRRGQFARLRGYTPQDRGTFEVWLAAVARRLCLDHYRQKYGRAPSNAYDDQAMEERAGRRRLVDLVGEALDVGFIPDPSGGSPERVLAVRELMEALTVALDALSHQDRLLLRFLFEEELTARETARLMRFPSQFHVYRRRNQVLGLLRRRLHQLGVRGAEP